MDTKYPDVTVRLIGTDGNAFAILAKVRSALRDVGATVEDVEAYTTEATSGDYDHLLGVTQQWVNVE